MAETTETAIYVGEAARSVAEDDEASVPQGNVLGDPMKASDARHMTVDQLDDELTKLKKEQFNLRFQRATGQLENTARVRQVRRDIARVSTIAAEKRAKAKA